jgi:hypothetical protein
MQMEGQGVLTVEKLDGDCMMGADAAAAAPGGELAMEWEEDPDDEVASSSRVHFAQFVCVVRLRMIDFVANEPCADWFPVSC